VKVVSWRKLRFRFDWTLTLATALVAGLGLLNLWSAVHQRQAGLFTQQVSWLVLGGIAFLVVATLDYRFIARFGYLFYAIGMVLLVAVLARGEIIGGSRRWFDLGAFHVQPSEFMKVLLLVALAKHINDHPVLQGRSMRHMVVPFLFAAAPILLVAWQPDFSTALVLGLVFITMMLTARLHMRTLGAMAGLTVLAVAPLWEYGLRDYQKNRILAFVNPALSPASAWQPRQAMNAVGSGRFLGQGFLHGTQVRLRPLPALWTDFPFAVWAEEWGFVGCLVLLLVYGLLIFWILRISREARDRFGASLCIGCAAMLFWQVALNIGMVTGLLPVMGTTLPLVSYGGSSIMTILIALGLVMNVSVRRFTY
jgi:rod shape determining protein RodA